MAGLCSRAARRPRASWARDRARGWLARPAVLSLVAARSMGPDLAVDELLVPERARGEEPGE
eukprot:2327083-Alexandrium_andersonii.AAC.1